MGRSTRSGASYSSSCAATLSATLSRPTRLAARLSHRVRANSRCPPSTASVRFGDELRRRRRIVSRSLYGLWTAVGVLNPFAHFFFALQMFSHKLLRWLVPVWLVVVLAVNIPLAENGYYGLLLALQVAFYGLAALGLLLPERLGRCWLFYVPAYFTATNWGTLLGLLSFLTGRRHRVWQPAR